MKELAVSSELLKERTEFYKKQDEALKFLLDKLKLHVDVNGKVPMGVFQLFSTSNTSAEQIILNQAEKYKRKKYIKAKALHCLRHYGNLNEEIKKQIDIFKSEIQNMKENAETELKLDCTNLNELEMRVKKYRQVFNNYLLKNPWLKDENLEISNIKNQLDSLETIRAKQRSLLQEMQVFKGLEPEVKQAKQQLAKVKEEFLAADKAFML